MGKDDKSSGGFPGSSFIVVALLTAGVVFVANKPLESSRPPQPEQRIERHQTAQDIDARLWQDPLAAVAKARELVLKKTNGAADEAVQRSEAMFAEEVGRQFKAAGPGGLAVVAVLVSGGPYAERVEGRLRLRYAVLAGLAARGFVPTDNEHLGYFLPDAKSGLPEVVPFERFESSPTTDGASIREDCKGCRLLVLWLDSSDFYQEPLRKLATLAQRVAPAEQNSGPKKVRWRVLGPSSSDGLSVVVDEADRNGKAANIGLLGPHDMRFFSGAATVDDDVLLQRQTGQPAVAVADHLQASGVQLLRTIGTDDVLVRALMAELKQRGLRDQALGKAQDDAHVCDTLLDDSPAFAPLRGLAPSSIAIVSEWDTLYGRSLRQGFRYGGVNKPGFCVTRWNYVRGLDGRLPGDGGAPPSDNGRPKRDNKADPSSAMASDGTYFERPEGQSQFDYLRRLARRMQEEDSTLRLLHGPAGGIRAVGVLGNDVYDKLLVLQALQPALPHALFFTTDLDARMFHPSEQGWARNLIVASNFGLRLKSPLQRGFAPFRDSYQTSAFLTTMLAMDDLQTSIAGCHPDLAAKQAAVSQWFAPPRVFEVSRSGPFDYSLPAVSNGANAAAAASSAGNCGGAGAARLVAAVAGAGMAGTATANGRAGAVAAASAGTTASTNISANANTGANASASAAATRTAAAAACSRWNPERCSDIHPRPSPMVPDLPLTACFLVATPLLLALWAPPLLLSRRCQRRLRRFVGRGGHVGPGGLGRAPRAAVLVVAALLLAFVPPLLLAWYWPALGAAITAGGKPLSLTDGISPWPTYVIRLLTLVLCLHFVVRAWSLLTSNVDRIAREFRLGATRRNFMQSLQQARQREQGWGRLTALFSVRFYSERPGLLGRSIGMTASAAEFWKHYLLQNRARARVLRTLAWLVLMIVFSILVANALGDQPEAPRRGELTRTMQLWSSWLPGLAALFLIFFVVDATLLCVFFVRGLRMHRSNWPGRTLQIFQDATGVPAQHLDDWIDIMFIARRTKAIGALVYLPFIVLSLLLLARSSFFDDWYTPPSTVVLTGVSFAIVLGCALALRRAAEASRVQGIERMRDAILKARGAGNTGLAGQLDLLRERMEKLSEGAFAPYSRQPLLRAVLLPLLTFGGSSLFDYMTLFNL